MDLKKNCAVVFVFSVLMLDWGSWTFVWRCVGLASFWYQFGTVEGVAIVCNRNWHVEF